MKITIAYQGTKKESMEKARYWETKWGRKSKYRGKAIYVRASVIEWGFFRDTQIYEFIRVCFTNTAKETESKDEFVSLIKFQNGYATTFDILRVFTSFEFS